MATDIVSLNRVRYAGLDFDTIEDDLRAQLQLKFAASFNDFAVSSLGIVLLDIVAFGLDTLSFYLDRRATDTYLATARTRSSVSLLTRQLGYKMSAAVASSVDLEVAPSIAYAFALPIPAKFQFQGPNGTIFETGQAVTIPPSSTVPVSIPCYQGQTITETFTSDGTPNQVFQLTRVPSGWQMAQGSVTCTVNAAPFTESDFITFDATDQFEVGYNDQPPTVRFGDGVAGNIPVLNGSIVVTYVATLGSTGQVLSNTITNVVTPLVVGFTTINLTITNPAASVGGSDLEDLQHAQTFAPLVFKSRQVAVTQGDYRALAGSYADPLFGRVAVAEAISSRSAATDIELQNLLVDISDNLSAATLAVQNFVGFNTWSKNTAYGASAYIVPNPSNGSFYQAFQGGISGSTQPIFPTILGATVQDGTLVWTCQGPIFSANGLALAAAALAATIQSQTDLTSVASHLTSVFNNETQIITLSNTISGDATLAQADYSDANTAVTNGKTFVNGLTAGGSTVITDADRATILGYFNTIASLLTLINGLAANMGSTAASQISVVQQSQSILQTTVGISTATAATLLNDLNTQLTTISTSIGISTSPYSGIFAVLQGVLAASTLNQTNITDDTAAINAHVDAILSADCRANLVSVPILSLDASGFYAAPSIGLINSLQAYLDGIKEVTQNVVVASGVGFLVPAVIQLRIGVDTGTSLPVTAATATSIVDGICKGRAFGVNLYVSDLIQQLYTISGIRFVNVTILGYRPVGSPSVLSDKIDAQGNLIIQPNEVITLSQSDFVVNTEVFMGTST